MNCCRGAGGGDSWAVEVPASFANRHPVGALLEATSSYEERSLCSLTAVAERWRDWSVGYCVGSPPPLHRLICFRSLCTSYLAPPRRGRLVLGWRVGGGESARLDLVELVVEGVDLSLLALACLQQRLVALCTKQGAPTRHRFPIPQEITGPCQRSR